MMRLSKWIAAPDPVRGRFFTAMTGEMGMTKEGWE